MRVGRALLVVGGSAALGCSLLVSTAGLVGEGRAPPDASGDASLDGPSADGAVVDAGSDASDGEAGTWCESLSPRPRICLDFDRGGFPDAGTVLTTSGTLALDTTAPRSPPNVLVAATDPGRSALAGMALEFPLGSPTRVTWAFDVRLDAMAAGGYVEFSEVVVVMSATASCAIQPFMTSTSPQMAVTEYCNIGGGTTSSSLSLGGLPPLGTWTRLRLTLELGSPSHITVAVNDEPTPRVSNAALNLTTPGVATLRLGPYYVPLQSGVTRMSFDNVTVDYP